MDKEKQGKKKSTIQEVNEDRLCYKRLGLKELKSASKDTNSDDNHTFAIKKQATSDLFLSNAELMSDPKVTPEGFYIAHPKNIKRMAHFKDVHSRKLAELLEAFHMFDFDRDGAIGYEDLKKTFASLCIQENDEEITQMLSEGLDPVNFDAFVILLGYKTLDLDPEEVLLDALSNWDEHREGLISHERIKRHLMIWGDKFTEDEATSVLSDAPVILNKAKEKMIDYIQFSEDLCGLRKMMQRKQDQ